MKKTKKQILRSLMILSFAMFSMVLKSQVVSNIDWVQHYVYRDSVDNSASAIDADNNVYVTGYGFNGLDKDLVVIKYDSLGNLIWLDTYDNGGDDEGMGVKVDATGNVYVVATSYDATSGLDIVTRVYNSGGTLIMHDRFDAGSNNTDVAADIELNKTSGDFFVIGSSMVSFDFNVTVLKYNSVFSLDWSNTYNSGFDDTGISLSVLYNNDVYCTARIYDGVEADAWTFMVDNSGSKYGWDNFVGQGSGGDDEPQDMVLSGADAVVCGKIWNASNTDWDYFTRRIDGNGNTIWHKDYDSVQTMNYATSLVRDSIGNIAVTGLVMGSSGWEYHTIMYDSTGVFLWPQANKEKTNMWGFMIEPRIAVDTVAHHFYVAGSKQNSTSDVMVYQISPFSGNTLWTHDYDGPLSGNDFGTGLTVSGLGIIYLIANCENSVPGYNQTTIRISQTPCYFPIDLGTPELNDENFVFQKNNGQVRYTTGSSVPANEVTYFYQGKNPSYYINKGRLSSLLLADDTVNVSMPDSSHRVDLVLFKHNLYSYILPSNEYAATTNYFFTSPSGIVNNKSYEKLSLPNIYHNVDLHYYSNTNGLKMYFVFKTSTALANPIIRIQGADSTNINGNGELIAYTNLGIINYGLVTAYQVTNTALATAPVTGSSAWNNIVDDDYNFNVTGYIPGLPIIVCISKPGATTPVSAAAIDNLKWSTFIGNQGDEEVIGSTTDSKDNYYTVGITASANFPALVGPYKNVPNNASGVRYGILNKFDKNGTPVYGTYFGGNSVSSLCNNVPFTKLYDVTVDSLFNIYLVGATSATDIPMQSSGTFNYSTNSALAANGLCINAIYAKLSPTGNDLRHSTYFGGARSEDLRFIKYRNGEIMCGGRSSSSSIPLVTPAANTTQYNTGTGMFLHLDTTGVLIHNSKISGHVEDGDFDNNGNMYLIGTIQNITMTVVQPTGFYAVGPTITTPPYAYDWHITRFSSTDSITWATYFGGTNNDFATAIDIRDSVMAIVGYGNSGNFPWKTVASDSGNTFIRFSDEIQMAKFNIKDGSQLWAAYHATTNFEQAFDVVLDKDYNMFVTGYLQCASGFSASCSNASFRYLQATNYYFQNAKIGYDAFLLGFTFDNKRKWTTSFGTTSPCGGSCAGASNDEWGKTLAINSKSQLFMSGFTRNKNNKFPLSKWNSVCYYDSTVSDSPLSGAADMYISMFDVNNFKVVSIKENEEVTVHDNMTLYPNPNDGHFKLSLNEIPSLNSTIRVINAIGQTVYEDRLRQESKEIRLDLGYLKSGIYFLSLTEGNSVKTIKFIIN